MCAEFGDIDHDCVGAASGVDTFVDASVGEGRVAVPGEIHAFSACEEICEVEVLAFGERGIAVSLEHVGSEEGEEAVHVYEWRKGHCKVWIGREGSPDLRRTEIEIGASLSIQNVAGTWIESDSSV